MTDSADYLSTPEGYRAYRRLAGKLLEQCASEVRRRRMPLGARDLHPSTGAHVAWHSYLSAVRTLLHPKSFWMEFIEIDQHKVRLGVMRELIGHFGEENARQVAEWAITQPPAHVPTFWKNGRK